MRPGTLEAALREVRTERAARLANEAELRRADDELGRLRALLEAYRSLAEAAAIVRDCCQDQGTLCDGRFEMALANYDAKAATVAELEGKGREG